MKIAFKLVEVEPSNTSDFLAFIASRGKSFTRVGVLVAEVKYFSAV